MILWYIVAGMGALALVVSLLGRWFFSRSSRSQRLRPGFMCMVVGLRGGGKSLFVCRMISVRVAAGVPVYANFHVDGAVFISCWRDAIMAPRGSFVILDEAHEWAGARAGQTLRPAAKWYNSQCRKLDHEVFVITQHESLVAGVVVALVNEFILCRELAFGQHRASAFAPHEFRKRDAKPLWSWNYNRKEPAASTYKTKDLIPPEKSRKQNHDDDVDMIVECIDLINTRDALAVDLDLQLAGWNQSAGLRG